MEKVSLIVQVCNEKVIEPLSERCFAQGSYNSFQSDQISSIIDIRWNTELFNKAICGAALLVYNINVCKRARLIIVSSLFAVVIFHKCLRLHCIFSPILNTKLYTYKFMYLYIYIFF